MVASPKPIPLVIPRRRRGDGRTIVRHVRLTPEVDGALAAFASRHESTVSTVLSAIARQVAHGDGNLVVVLAEPSPMIRAMAHQLARIGNNLNQIAHELNSGRAVDPTFDLHELRMHLRHLRRTLSAWV